MTDQAKNLKLMLETINFERAALEEERRQLIQKIQSLNVQEEKIKNQLEILENRKVSKINWAEKQCDWTEEIKLVLRNRFKLQYFRHQQLAAINAVLSKCDVLLVMPTGGGKSLCYQLPALVTKGVTVVISPLISLIEDQIIALKKLNIPCIALNSNTNKEDVKLLYASLSKGPIKYKLIYITPEWLAKSKRFKSSLQKCYDNKMLDRIAIDEVHCCSQWGHDFRRDYKHLEILKILFPDVPIIGLTATATEDILGDVQRMLGIGGCLLLKSPYNRPNLYYEVRQKPANPSTFIASLANLIQDKYKDQSGIIYTNTIKDCVDLAIDLKAKGVAVACYHANLTSVQRSKVHVKWLENHYQVVVATVAFGMGIDKPDVRFVIHHTVPKSMANYYQESGRAGRDDKNSDCIIYYSSKDVFKISPMVSSQTAGSINLYNVIKYCLDFKNCRRQSIATHFSDVWSKKDCKNMCDHCRNPKAYKKVDITKYYQEMCSILQTNIADGNKLTANKLVETWIKKYGSKVVPKELIENILAFLLINNYLKEDLHFSAYNSFCYISQTDKKVKSGIFMDTSQRISNLPHVPAVTSTEIIEIDKEEPCQDLNEVNVSNDIKENNVIPHKSEVSTPLKDELNESSKHNPSSTSIKRKNSQDSKQSQHKKMKLQKPKTEK